MYAVNELYCGSLPGKQPDASEADKSYYAGCIYSAEQVPMKAGTFAALAFGLGLLVMHLRMK